MASAWRRNRHAGRKDQTGNGKLIKGLSLVDGRNVCGERRLRPLLIKKILLPIDFPTTSVRVIQQAVTLAEHFQAEIVTLHVAPPDSQAGRVPNDDRDLANWNMVAEILGEAEQKFAPSRRTKLETVAVPGVVRVDPARAILQAAQAENADLIMMPSTGYTFDQFLLGSATAKVLPWKECPVWTGAYREEPSAQEFSIHNVLCAVDLGPRSQEAASWAMQLAAEFGARLTLSHVTESMAILAPGGRWANPEWQQDLVRGASRRLTELQKNLPLKADLLVGSGDVPQVLSEFAIKTKADLLVLDCYPYSGNLRIHGYGIIRTVSVPVLSV